MLEENEIIVETSVDNSTVGAHIDGATGGKRPKGVLGATAMEHFKNMPIAAMIEMSKHVADPVQFGKDLLTYIGAELSTAIRAEMADRIERQKAMSKDAKALMIEFKE